MDDLVARLREVCVDWTGELIADDSTPRYEVNCRLLREAATALERQAGLIADLKRGLVEAAIPLEAAILAGKSPYMSDALWDGIVAGAEAARATLGRMG